MITKIQSLLLTLALLSTLNSQLATAQAQGTAFTYQGRLNDGTNPAGGIYDLRFAIYDSSASGSQLGILVTNAATAVSNGLFTVALDFGNQFSGADRWLEIGVRTNGSGNFTTLTPRQKLTPAPYAIFAEGANAAGLSGTIPMTNLSGTYSGPVTFNNAGDRFTGNGTGLTNVDAAALNGLNAASFWQLGGNTVTSGQFIGSVNNQALDFFADGVRALRLILRTDASGIYSNAPNVIGGSSVNQVDTGVVGGTIGGGGGNAISGTSYPNQVSADFGTVSGGVLNTANSLDATVGGGGENSASGIAATVGGGYTNSTSGDYATVGGGVLNIASAQYSMVGGGVGNAAKAIGSFIGGGGDDGSTSAGNLVLSKAATIGGGLGNDIPGGAEYAFIGGGDYNTNSGASGTLSGGENNTVSGVYATVGGGKANTASGDYATVAGGGQNTASGNHATVGGGIQNTASGNFSFAAGGLAQATNTGSFVWADDHNVSFPSTANNQFSARAIGGVRFVTAIDGSGTPTAGVKLNSGDTSWGTISDRNAKKNFQPVDGEAILQKLAAIPVEKWNYKWEADTNTPHLGPMAQDFKAAFYPGRDDKSITTLEFDGVELAAIQGLNQKLQSELNRQDAENVRLKQQNDSLAQRLNKLEATVKQLAGKN